jgi:hypothetical protein
MKHLAEVNHDWMKIAYISEQARNIIQHNKLAVILGVEIDQLGQLSLDPDAKKEPQVETDYLWKLGARAVIPIHAANNKIGGPAIFIEPYNWLNDLLHRPNLNATSSGIRKTPPQYFRIQGDDADCSPKPTQNRGECVLRALVPDFELRVAVGRPLFNWFHLSPVLLFESRVEQFVTLYGHKNQQGLNDFGRDYLSALMDRGMILDRAHMSDRSMCDTYEAIGKRLALPECKNIWFDDAPECNANAYPAIISHAHFRAQGIYEDTQVDDYKPSEYDISDGNLKMVRRLAAVVGPFVTEGRIDPVKPGVELPFPPNGGNYSINFAYSFRYADRAVNTPADAAAGASRVGFATDMTFIPTVSPRFGPNACDGYNVKRHGKRKSPRTPNATGPKRSTFEWRIAIDPCRPTPAIAVAISSSPIAWVTGPTTSMSTGWRTTACCPTCSRISRIWTTPISECCSGRRKAICKCGRRSSGYTPRAEWC